MASNPPTRDEVQAEAVEAILDTWDGGARSTVLQKPTQTGKTRATCKLIRRVFERDPMSRFLIEVHLGEILDQWGDELSAMGIPFLVEKAGQRGIEQMRTFNDVRVCLASHQTLAGPRLEAIEPGFFTHGVKDECHLSVAPSWLAVDRRLGDDAKILGASATIDRLDGVPLGTLYDSTAFQYPITEAIANGHRAPFRCVAVEADDVDIRGLKPSDVGSFSDAEVAARLMPRLEPIAKAVAQQLERLNIKHFVAFLPNVKCVYAFADLMRRLGHESHGVDHENEDRKAVIDQYKAGTFPGLINHRLLGMGFSSPHTEAVILLNPTTSRAWFDQQSGRAGATYPGKEYGHLIFVKWVADHDLMGPTDIFAGDMSARVKSKAKKQEDDADDYDPQDLIAAAQEEVDREDADAEDLQRTLKEKTFRYNISPDKIERLYREFNPLAKYGVLKALAPQQFLQDVAHSKGTATQGQRRLLESFGLDASTLTESQARPVCEQLLRRDLEGLPDARDVMSIVSLCGFTPERALGLSREEADRTIRLEMSRRNLKRGGRQGFRSESAGPAWRKAY